MALASITIDVDSLRFYREIHGLPSAPSEAPDPIYTIALPRFFELLAECGAPATLFLIGADAPAHASAIRAGVAASRSEVASHSFSHDYRLSTQSDDAIRDDLSRGHTALLPLAGDAPIVGFRAPGYNVSSAMLKAVAQLGYRYDSSLLPSPWYFAARGSAIAAYRARGRRTHSLLGNPRQFLGPLAPYRFEPDAPWRDGGTSASMLELPMACDPITRLWLIGTTWVLLPPALRELALDSALRRLSHFNFEMHAIDLLHPSDSPELADLARVQPDLRVPVSAKIAAFSKLFGRLRRERNLLTLRDAAAEF
jgi:hypothetical protein